MAEVKAVLLAPAPGATLVVVDVGHGVRRHHVREGAYLLRAAVHTFPAGTVHLAVVDPGVGTERRALVVRAGGHLLVGPDNGLLWLAAWTLGRPEFRELVHPDLRRIQVSSTFWGRDVFAPAARWLALGFPFEDVGPPVADPVLLPAVPPRREAGRLWGEVALSDTFGNLSTNIPGEWLEDLPECVWVEAAGRVHAARRVRTYGDAEAGQLVVLVGSDGFAEVAVREGDARATLGCAPGDLLVLRA